MTARRAVNTNRQGANFELQIMEHLRVRGYDVLRSSGSRGSIDVVAVGDTLTLWIQAKISNPLLSPADRSAVTGVAKRADGIPLVAYRDNGRVVFRLLTGTGPKDWAPFEPRPQDDALCGTCGHLAHEHALSGSTGCWTSDAETEAATCPCTSWIPVPHTPKPKTPKTREATS